MEVPSYKSENLSSIKSESRFGDKESILEAMREGEIELLGDLDELFPGKIAEHINMVEGVEINSNNISPMNNVLPATVMISGHKISCIFLNLLTARCSRRRIILMLKNSILGRNLLIRSLNILVSIWFL